MKRKKIGLAFKSNYKTWAGGVIYIINIISALNTLDDEDKPELFIYYSSDSPLQDIKKIGYPYINYLFVKDRISLFQRLLDKLCYFFLKKSFFFNEVPDVIYPNLPFVKRADRKFYWIPDFQERHLPQFFSKEEIESRIKNQEKISRQTKSNIIFSSHDSLKDYKNFYPNNKCNLFVLNFASTLPSFNHLDINIVKNKFGIRSPYFMAPNQFWKHKNHIIILKALTLLKSKDLDFKIIFTGSENDHRNKEYFSELKDYIKENHLQHWVSFLGFIDREEQLLLMENSLAIIQPSLFEGWSTVVEDAKALSQFIVLSNINVHKEQISENCFFFNPHSAFELAVKIEEILLYGVKRKVINYSNNIKEFGRAFVKIIK